MLIIIRLGAVAPASNCSVSIARHENKSHYVKIAGDPCLAKIPSAFSL